MGAIRNDVFDLEFINRTKAIIQEYDGEYNITLLLNCLLGLIVLPSEYYNRNRRIFFNTDINNIQELNELMLNNTFDPTKRQRTGLWVNDNRSLKNLIKKVRNAVSHQRIECIGDNGNWIGVRLIDINQGNNNNVELDVNWTTIQLKNFALFVADSYLREVERI